jgi:hypothetical protein
VHLAGKSDTSDMVAAEVRRSERLSHGNAAGAPPVFGPLFRPPDLRGSERFMLLYSGCNDASLLIDEECAGTAGPNVYAENNHDFSLSQKTGISHYL